jgi:hypothetical protein
MRTTISNTCRITVAMLFAILAVPATASTVIDFEDVAGGTSIFTPTDVSAHYAAQGVTFSDSAGPSGVILSSAPGYPTPLNNVFFAHQHQSTDDGDLFINFSQDATAVSLNFYLSADYFLSYATFDSGNALISSGSTAPLLISGAEQILSLSDIGVRSLRLTSHASFSGGDRYGNFGIDNLKFATGAATSAVPEPSAWATMIAGFGIIGGLARRKRRVSGSELGRHLS